VGFDGIVLRVIISCSCKPCSLQQSLFSSCVLFLLLSPLLRCVVVVLLKLLSSVLSYFPFSSNCLVFHLVVIGVLFYS
jgi:hypothetical protein